MLKVERVVRRLFWVLGDSELFFFLIPNPKFNFNVFTKDLCMLVQKTVPAETIFF